MIYIVNCELYMHLLLWYYPFGFTEPPSSYSAPARTSFHSPWYSYPSFLILSTSSHVTTFSLLSIQKYLKNELEDYLENIKANVACVLCLAKWSKCHGDNKSSQSRIFWLETMLTSEGFPIRESCSLVLFLKNELPVLRSNQKICIHQSTEYRIVLWNSAALDNMPYDLHSNENVPFVYAC